MTFGENIVRLANTEKTGRRRPVDALEILHARAYPKWETDASIPELDKPKTL